ncbi:MAG: right-handed parallel beta-helix repeat-containing protein [Solobacterium sp.]|nr:right-handed parallel beta-helix repeat-containing protein [Solobacterium sp.]
MTKKIEALQITLEECLKPIERQNEIINNVKPSLNYPQEIIFDGNSTSELNEFLSGQSNVVVKINKSSLQFDGTINIPSNIVLVGAPTTIKDTTNEENVIFINQVNHVNIRCLDVSISRKAINIRNSENVLIEDCQFSYCNDYAMVINGSSNIQISKNTFDQNLSGISVTGGSHNVVIEANRITNGTAMANALAGIVLDSSNFIVPELFDENAGIEERRICPHDIVIQNNYIADNRANGIYCVGPYYTYIVGNKLTSNDKEGICLDWGTIGTYLADNTISLNGYRRKQTDEDLVTDFIDSYGRLEDGSSPAKLPGVSLDNAMWNIIANNQIQNNAGSGIKSVRAAIENLIVSNSIMDNNVGESQNFRFFGIELGNALGGEEQDLLKKRMDFTSNYGNIVARNLISGSHYVGIFFADGCYGNVIMDNSILEAKRYAIENLSNEDNYSLNNYTTGKVKDFNISDSIFHFEVFNHNN